MSKTEKILFGILGVLIILLICLYLCIGISPKSATEEKNTVSPRYIYVCDSPEIHAIWNPFGYVYIGVAEINGEKTEFVLQNDCDKIYAFPSNHFAHIDHPDLFYGEVCKCSPIFEGISSYNPGYFSISVTKDYKGVFSEAFPELIFNRYDITEYRNGSFDYETEFGYNHTAYIYTSATGDFSIIWDDSEHIFIGKTERDGEITEFVLLEKEDNFYALPVSHLAHMAHPSLFAEDECIKAPIFEGKTVYTNGLSELHITKDQSEIFGGDLPKITLSRFDKSEYFGKD